MTGPWLLPPRWAWATAGDVAMIVGGGTPDTKRAEYFGGDIPWLTPADLSGYSAKYIGGGARTLTEAGYRTSGAQLMPEGTVIFSSRAPIGYVAIASNAICTNQGFKSFVPNGSVHSDYLYYYLMHAKPLVVALASGTTFLEVSGKKIGTLPVPIPPLPEQRRITDALDELLSDLDAGVAALERVRAKLKHYRAAVLKAAAEGALTAEWRREHPATETADALRNRILAERRRLWEEAQLAKFEAAGKPPHKDWKAKYVEPVAPRPGVFAALPHGWRWVTVDQCIISPIVNGISIKGSDSPPGIASLRLSAMTDAGFDYAERRYLPLSPEDVDDLWIQPGDFFVCRGNGSKKLVGRGTLAQDPKEAVIFPDTMMRLRISSIVQAAGWVSSIWQSSVVRNQIEKAAKTTAGIWKVSQPDLTGIVLPLPPLQEQKKIVEMMADQLSVIDHLEHDLDLRLNNARALRQSILRYAFTGHLVAQDRNDEPASELLKRIAVEREERARLTKTAKVASPATRTARARARKS